MKTVLVVLGARASEQGQMPATITVLPSKPSGKVYYQHLSPDQLEAMDGDQTAYWDAEIIDGHVWLETRQASKVPAAVFEKWQRTPVKIDEKDLPF